MVLLVIHHSFPAIPKEYLHEQALLITQLVSAAKLCVGIFAVLSGYGMYMSYQKHLQKEDSFLSNSIYMLKHILYIYEIFWLTAIPAIIVVAATRKSMPEIYGYPTIVHLVLNLAGVSWFTGTPVFVNSWWYISAVLLYYCMFPFVFYMVRSFKKGNYVVMALLIAAEAALPGLSSIPVYGIFFVFGMILAERDILNRFLAWEGQNFLIGSLRCILLAMTVVGLILLRQRLLYETRYEYHFDYLIVMPLCLLAGSFVRWRQIKIPGLLEFTGILSFPMYIIHGCLLKYYGQVVIKPITPWKVFLRVYLPSLAIALLVKLLQRGERKLVKIFMEH